jgi:hypothetical protein
VGCVSVINNKRDVLDWLMMVALGVAVTGWIAWLSATAYALFSAQ